MPSTTITAASTSTHKSFQYPQSDRVAFNLVAVKGRNPTGELSVSAIGSSCLQQLSRLHAHDVFIPFSIRNRIELPSTTYSSCNRSSDCAFSIRNRIELPSTNRWHATGTHPGFQYPQSDRVAFNCFQGFNIGWSRAFSIRNRIELPSTEHTHAHRHRRAAFSIRNRIELPSTRDHPPHRPCGTLSVSAIGSSCLQRQT